LYLLINIPMTNNERLTRLNGEEGDQSVPEIVSFSSGGYGLYQEERGVGLSFLQADPTPPPESLKGARPGEEPESLTLTLPPPESKFDVFLPNVRKGFAEGTVTVVAVRQTAEAESAPNRIVTSACPPIAFFMAMMIIYLARREER
jgi:hypothetical protein